MWNGHYVQWTSSSCTDAGAGPRLLCIGWDEECTVVCKSEEMFCEQKPGITLIIFDKPSQFIQIKNCPAAILQQPFTVKSHFAFTGTPEIDNR